LSQISTTLCEYRLQLEEVRLNYEITFAHINTQRRIGAISIPKRISYVASFWIVMVLLAMRARSDARNCGATCWSLRWRVLYAFERIPNHRSVTRKYWLIARNGASDINNSTTPWIYPLFLARGRACANAVHTRL